MEKLKAENRSLKTTIDRLEFQAIRDDLIFDGLPEKEEDVEKTVRDFLAEKVRLSNEELKRISLSRVQRMGRKVMGNNRPRPILVTFGSMHDKETVKKKKKNLAGTTFGVNDHFTQTVMERRKILIPVMKKARIEKKKAILVGDKLFVNDTLYTDKSCPWVTAGANVRP